MDAETLRDLADKQAIRDLIYTYCRAVDRLDIPLGHSIWHEDGYADYGAAYYQGPGRGVIDLICQSHLGLLSHSHQVTNILANPTSPAPCAASAMARPCRSASGAATWMHGKSGPVTGDWSGARSCSTTTNCAR